MGKTFKIANNVKNRLNGLLDHIFATIQNYNFFQLSLLLGPAAPAREVEGGQGDPQHAVLYFGHRVRADVGAAEGHELLEAVHRLPDGVDDRGELGLEVVHDQSQGDGIANCPVTRCRGETAINKMVNSSFTTGKKSTDLLLVKEW